MILQNLPLATIGDDDEPATLGRREFLRRALVVVAGMAFSVPLSGCSDATPPIVGADTTQAPVQPTATISNLTTDPTPAPVQPTATGASGADSTPEPAQQTAINNNVADTPAQAPTQMSATNSKILLAYFSRAGENYYYGGRTQLEVGNTEVVAGMISQLIDCDVYRIEASEPYSNSYDDTVARNVREQQADARPAIANPLSSISQYDVVLLGSPIWNVRAPMIMSTFAESSDFSGKKVFPFTTYAMSGLGTTVRDYAASCPGATIGEGLAVRGEEVQDSAAAVEEWLRRINLLGS